jgi:hypothetical protein
MKRLLFSVMLFLWLGQASSQETTITILGVRINNVNQARAQELLQSIPQRWAPAGIGPNNVAVNLANGGALVPLAIPSPPDHEVARLNAAKSVASALNIRNFYNADIVIFFTDEFDDPEDIVCGIAPQENWTNVNGPPAFSDPDSDGIDRTGSEDWYAAIMATTDVPCQTNPVLALHEFGHLFGAGHQNVSPWAGQYLFPDSHAYLIYLPWPYPSPIRSNLYTNWQMGINWYQYSDATGANNTKALIQTALSVGSRP